MVRQGKFEIGDLRVNSFSDEVPPMGGRRPLVGIVSSSIVATDGSDMVLAAG